MKYTCFEDYLKEVHSEGYRGTDDDMPDSYNDFLSEIDIDEWIAYGEDYAEKYALQLKNKLNI